ncbi:MAG: HPP family protein [Azonexus sp.]
MSNTAKFTFQRIKHFIGFPASGHHLSEQLVATLGGVISISLVILVTRALLGEQAALVIVPSLGASAVLIFAAPHSPFAQPWAVLGGHLLSALVGVTCWQLVPNATLAAGLAVGLAIGVMHMARCLHPPGGATALAAVIGGAAVHELGFRYVLNPIAINCVVILVVGVVFNYAFAWRRYPASLMRYRGAAASKGGVWPRISEDHVSAAMDHLNVVIDVDPKEMSEIIRQTLAVAQKQRDAELPDVKLGHYYCNDRPGQQWSVRQIIDERRSDNPEFDLVIYKVVDGKSLNRTGSCTRSEFARWVGSELQPRDRKP